MYSIHHQISWSPWLTLLLVVLGIWELIWKGLALWRSGQHRQKGWFICILVFNTVGILPIIYLYGFRPKSKAPTDTA